MFMPIMILGIVAVAIVALLLFMKTNAAVVFLALCAGNLLVTQLGYDATNAARIVTRNSMISNNGAQIAVLVLPAVLSALFLRGSIRRSKLFLNIIPAAAAGALGALLVTPLLPESVQHNITSAEQWQLLVKYQGAILIAGIISSMFVFWLGSRSKIHEEGPHKHKKH